MTLGAQMLEVHITFHKKMFGPDVPASLDLAQFSELIRGVRYIEKMTENPIDKTNEVKSLFSMRKLFTKSLVAKCDIMVGQRLALNNVALKKPGTGIPGEKLEQFLGQELARNVTAGTLLSIEDFS